MVIYAEIDRLSTHILHLILLALTQNVPIEQVVILYYISDIVFYLLDIVEKVSLNNASNIYPILYSTGQGVSGL